MAHTKTEVIKMINLDEPNYVSIMKKLSHDDVPVLIKLSQDKNPSVATKAISCLGLWNSENALKGVLKAAKHTDPMYRVAAAHALKNMSTLPGAVKVLDALLDDEDVGVKKLAMKSIPLSPDIQLKKKLEVLSEQDANEYIRKLATEMLLNMNKNQ